MHLIYHLLKYIITFWIWSTLIELNYMLETWKGHYWNILFFVVVFWLITFIFWFFIPHKVLWIISENSEGMSYDVLNELSVCTTLPSTTFTLWCHRLSFYAGYQKFLRASSCFLSTTGAPLLLCQRGLHPFRGFSTSMSVSIVLINFLQMTWSCEISHYFYGIRMNSYLWLWVT